jgi:hypothetical protein
LTEAGKAQKYWNDSSEVCGDLFCPDPSSFNTPHDESAAAEKSRIPTAFELNLLTQKN